jgi:hypothetical protein
VDGVRGGGGIDASLDEDEEEDVLTLRCKRLIPHLTPITLEWRRSGGLRARSGVDRDEETL